MSELPPSLKTATKAAHSRVIQRMGSGNEWRDQRWSVNRESMVVPRIFGTIDNFEPLRWEDSCRHVGFEGSQE
ncbi:MAG: hypothetical protein JOY67_22135 [Hyphomicrobiales bacterium]|nr:hypothetical protein [Hyphomicrobiales bacterium]